MTLLSVSVHERIDVGAIARAILYVQQCVQTAFSRRRSSQSHDLFMVIEVDEVGGEDGAKL